MKLGITVVSSYDKNNNKAGFIYELNLVDNGKPLQTKAFEQKSKTFPVSNRVEAEQIASSELQDFIDQAKEEYHDCELKIFYKKAGFLEKDVLQIKNNGVSFSPVMDPNFFSSKSKRLFNNILNSNVTEAPKVSASFLDKKRKSSNEASSKKKNKRKVPQHNSQNNQHLKLSIDDFVKKMADEESVQQQLFKKNIGKSNSKDVFINFSYVLEKERKRIGLLFEYYKNENDMINGKNPIHRYASVSHGEQSTAQYKINKQLKDNFDELKNAGKNITINIKTTSGYVCQSIKTFLDDLNISSKVNITEKNTIIHNKCNSILSQKIKEDLDIYLRELKDPNTVAMFTDGSVNGDDFVSGSGVVIKHQGKTKLLASKNEGYPDSTYSEFKAIELAIKEAASNKDFKGKKIMIVSDNDLMSYSIRNRLRGVSSGIDRPFLNEICQLIQDNDLKVYFHNVKSHIHEKIDPKKEKMLYDFHYNNVVDGVARQAAGLSIPKFQQELILKSLKEGQEDAPQKNKREESKEKVKRGITTLEGKPSKNKKPAMPIINKKNRHSSSRVPS